MAVAFSLLDLSGCRACEEREDAGADPALMPVQIRMDPLCPVDVVICCLTPAGAPPSIPGCGASVKCTRLGYNQGERSCCLCAGRGVGCSACVGNPSFHRCERRGSGRFGFGRRAGSGCTAPCRAGCGCAQTVPKAIRGGRKQDLLLAPRTPECQPADHCWSAGKFLLVHREKKMSQDPGVTVS